MLCTLRQTAVCRADGGFGGPSAPTPDPHPIPSRSPEHIFDWPTAPQQALICRLSGDDNPLHADPSVATGAGFPRPILHELSTYGMVCYAVVGALCEFDPLRLKRIDVRFSAPVLPGDVLRTEIWRQGNGVAAFRALVTNRGNLVAINNGLVEYDEA